MDFMDYLASLPAGKLDGLYESLWTCQAVLRSLPPLGKLYVLRLLHVEQAVGGKSLSDWAKPDAGSKHAFAVERLQRMRVLLETRERTGKKEVVSYLLNPAFQTNLRQALCVGGLPPREPASLKAGARQLSFSELDAYADRKWESILLELVASGSSSHSIITETFTRAGLISSNENGWQITELGFQFLLADKSTQLWAVLREYVAAAEDRGMDTSSLICFLLELGFLVVGQPYDTGGLTAVELKMVEELALLGLVKIQKGSRGESWFVGTRLAASLCASLSESSTGHTVEGFMLVETNFRVYAYTSSKLHLEILKLFVRVEYQLPNLVVGGISRESVNHAFACGIAADQIISYIRKHAHPKIAHRTPILPETVADQIRLWEHDRNRVKTTPAVYYENLPSKEMYDAVVRHVRTLGGLLWEHAGHRRLVVRADLHEEVRNFMRKYASRAQ
ncbi:hypothetical protein CBR_g44575 [Chara braunii]|uniref:RNA polymerase II transcription factor B subunit 2 n=1 Tax=Chara braunii TaxID=69332 RepID=A0A388LY30_CHABU|nr:hypothetical protein CBR_g44575 [Chara braunii]|eukprot:GBG87119.1 hypothetical protein CBR_g44575 [Chara braunii]